VIVVVSVIVAASVIVAVSATVAVTMAVTVTVTATAGAVTVDATATVDVTVTVQSKAGRGVGLSREPLGMVRMNAQSFEPRTLWIMKVNHLRDRARVELARDEGLLKGSPMVVDVVLQ
jgi:hypothetical protein